MKGWIISIVGVICLGILLEIVLPEGKTAKYVRGAFSLLVVFSIAAPLPGLIKGGAGFSASETIEADAAYESEIISAYLSRMETAAEKALEESGISASASAFVSEDGGVRLVICLDKPCEGGEEAATKAIEDSMRIAPQYIKVVLKGEEYAN